MRVVVFTGNLSYSVRKGIVEIDEATGDLEWLVVLHAPRKTPLGLLRSQWLNLKRNGWRWIPYQLAEVWQRVRVRLRRPTTAGISPADVRAPSTVAPPGGLYELDALRSRPNLRLLRTEDLHGDDVLAAVRDFAPDLGLSIAAPILRKPLFELPRLGTINLHKGRVPDYRGMPPAFWELWNGEVSVGCTVHRVDARLDAGDVVAETTVVRARHATLRGLQLQLDEVGVALMRDAALALLAGSADAHPQPAGGRTYRRPTLAQVAQLGRRMTVDRTHGSSPAVAAAKSARSAVMRWMWRAGGHRAASPRITVLLYHRVSDDVRDNLTVGIEQFDRQMALLREHCRVLSIDEVLRTDHPTRSSRPLVAVTFDDGYEDNFTHAAPILLRHRIPAAFFVSTGIVDSDRRFPHDVRRGNPPIPVLSWQQIRLLHRWGFTIGSHSVTHIDCAAEPEDVVRHELQESRAALERELGVTDPIFGYPYGGRQHMTPERLELVRRAGYRGCLSAYGGSNVGHVDRFDVRRSGIHWEFSDAAFLYQCLGL